MLCFDYMTISFKPIFCLFQEGDIWPNSTAELTVVFKPKEAKSYQRTAYCDITGRESRLPLKVRGDGMGPKLVFSLDCLDIGNVFAGSTHTYEVRSLVFSRLNLQYPFCSELMTL